MKTKHTPGRWRVSPGGQRRTDILSPCSPYVVAQVYSGPMDENHADNAERIVACVNALKDIEDPEAFVKAAHRVLGEMAYLRATNDIRDSVNNYSDEELEADGRAMGVPNLFDADGAE